ncbi:MULTISPECIES: helix-turn-helix transcriptional regulator [Halomonadaceae]|uniref:AlpA family phage regulatory protein n=2 Tax=Vreelandella neptunia TaxID=115551 RepID=A0ABZ0YJF5_9GAMM|nr:MULTISPECIES: helix-turn-helix domain-containing protein [Halomonas]MCH4813924.1 AlpA family phage regulatory protein [Halomonas neptunia]MDN3562096.1 AlpA family phage regulatory protein [Halomonas neptunia]WQH11799.1 AlpA family phage regulatory protein [Halomonas neptunia]|tara:strand:+ start:504 stop:695 length:192 start_codon:yes stop_codon:yes gene_type:complete
MLAKYLSAADLASRFGVSKATIWRWKREGQIPSPIYLGARCTRWREEDIQTYEKGLIADAALG